MTDLQLGLVIIGVLAVAGVLLYNRLQERSARRHAEGAFGSSHADVLLEQPASRREPVLSPQARETGAPHAGTISDPLPASMPDERVDYIVALALRQPVAAGSLLELWTPIERRFGKRAMLAGSDGKGWRRLAAGDAESCTALRAGLQLVSREGVTSEAELIEFRSEAETLAGQIGAAISAPGMRESLEAAAELDRACADADIQVALHVAGAEVDGAALAEFEDANFRITRRPEGLTFTLDVPRVLEIGRSYEAMARAARQVASAAGGRLEDDNGRTLDDRALAAIGAQLEPVRLLLAQRGIEPGSPLALRLFS